MTGPAARRVTKMESGDKNYRLMIQEAPAQGSVSDPARQIGGWVSFETKWLTLNLL